MMKKRPLVAFLIVLLLLMGRQLSAQVGINADGSQPDPSAGLDIKFSDKGFLPPRMTHAQKMAIPDPASGLIVFCTDCDTTGILQIFVNGSWNNLVHSGGSATNPGSSVVTTTAVTGISQNFAFSGGNVTVDGGYSVTERGVCWNTAPNPVAAGSHVSGGAGIGAFSSIVTGLLPGTAYYLRAYATNVAGTSYGNTYYFTTLSGNLPAITTTPVSGITQSVAVSGGNVTSAGGAQVYFRGVCWSTSPSPTTSNSHTTDGSGTGVFTSNITGLASNTVYYVRAYAVNSYGTIYGNEQSFLSLSLPSLTTYSVTSLAVPTASGGGNITSDGGSPVVYRGVCWSTSPNPTIADSHTTDGSGSGAFTSALSGLDTNHFYYVRAYAVNSAGTGYGNQIIFSTYHVGQAYGGGVIFYIDNTIARLYISATSDQSTGAPWGCAGTSISGLSAILGSGQANTTAIVNGCSSPGIAARICDQLVLNGYSDWFLPSQNEMTQLYFQRSVVGGFTTGRYWISNQFDATQAMVKDFSAASGTVYPKDALYFVRAIRME